ncbi:hypothetical protein OEZ86_010306 [Tetradesmus obliquus]|nr:hypothetical protein OEZ86_010306 [Tetradesmus obliquus]
MIAGGGSGGGSYGLSPAAMDAIGYAGGGVLAVCLIPQIGKIVLTRSARDISYAWSVMYMIGMTLSLAYLIMKDAMAAWIPLVIEIAGCIAIILLKTLFEHTARGRKWSAAKQQQQLQSVLSGTMSRLDASVHSLSGITHCMSLQGAVAQAAAEGSVRALVAELNASKRGTPSPHWEVTCSSVDPSTPTTAAAAASAGSPRHSQEHNHNSHAQGLFSAGWGGLQPVQPLQQQQQQQQQGVPHWMEGHTGAAPGL